MDCNTLLTDGIPIDCDSVKGQVGVGKDLTIVEFDSFDQVLTLDPSNFEADDTNGNEGGLSKIILKTGATQLVFEGKDYSIKPSVSGETNDDNDTWYTHTIAFTAFNKTSAARKSLEALSGKRVIAITVDRSTGLYELFGAEQGLSISEVSREYTGSQNSNFYAVTLNTPEIAVIKEYNLGHLANEILETV